MYALYVYLGAALYSENKFSSPAIAGAIIFYGIGAVIGSLTGGRLTDRFGEKKISRVTLIFLTLILVCLSICSSFGFSSMIIFLGVLTFFLLWIFLFG